MNLKDILEALNNTPEEQLTLNTQEVLDHLNQAETEEADRQILLTHVKTNPISSLPLFDPKDIEGDLAAVFSLMLDASWSMEGWEETTYQAVQDVYVAYRKSAFYKANPKGLLFGINSFNEGVKNLLPYMHYRLLGQFKEEMYQVEGLTDIPNALRHQVSDLLIQGKHLQSYGKEVRHCGLFVTDGHDTCNSASIPETRKFLDKHLHTQPNMDIAFLATHEGAIQVGKDLGFILGDNMVYIAQGKLNTEEFQQKLRHAVKLASEIHLDDISKYYTSDDGEMGM